jgi:hypothetical protein
MKILLLAVVLISTYLISPVYAKKEKVPGIVVDHLPASGKAYIGSPSIAILPNGDYVASHDFFGPASTEHTQALTVVFRSADKGRSWKKIAEINGQFWSNLFVHQQALYIMGTWKHHGNIIIRKSLDGGTTWSEPTNGSNGLLFEGEFHTAPMPMVIYHGRLCRAFENARSFTTRWGIRYSAGMLSALLDADLLDAKSWTTSNFLPCDTTLLDGKFGGWLEGNAVVTPEGKLVDFLRVATSEKGRDMAAMVEISEDGRRSSFSPAIGFMDFIGGSRKFSIRYDEKSRRYWTISNMITAEFATMPAGAVRNTLVLKSSLDLRKWSTDKILLHHPDVLKHGFQYVDWQFDGKDIIFLSRTAFDDEFGGADNYHNANYLTFHRIKNFRKLASKSR